jgi:hypothetical protein
MLRAFLGNCLPIRCAEIKIWYNFNRLNEFRGVKNVCNDFPKGIFEDMRGNAFVSY